ncbi:MAG: nucleotidyltransferase domain-containing protein [Oscillospiraceae bacterium]|nr:nucleotidyltransferase domain-containing protein [Oscillospiraceae bacterium]
MLGKSEVREIAQKYSEEVKKALKPVSVILFGSYVNGNPHADSDIDVAVLVNNIADDNWYDTCVLLQRLRRNGDFLDIEPHLLDPNQDPSGFVEHVIKTGEVIYQSA